MSDYMDERSVWKAASHLESDLTDRLGIGDRLNVEVWISESEGVLVRVRFSTVKMIDARDLFLDIEIPAELRARDTPEKAQQWDDWVFNGCRVAIQGFNPLRAPYLPGHPSRSSHE